jgi:hypothetical protein
MKDSFKKSLISQGWGWMMSLCKFRDCGVAGRIRSQVFDYINLFFLNAKPDELFKYFSKFSASFLVLKDANQTNLTGRKNLVDLFLPFS